MGRLWNWLFGPYHCPGHRHSWMEQWIYWDGVRHRLGSDVCVFCGAKTDVLPI